MSTYDLDAISALVIKVAIDLAYRTIRSKYRQTPLSVAPAPSRFSDPEGHYTVLYGTTSPSCSLWEAVFCGRFVFTALGEQVLPAPIPLPGIDASQNPLVWFRQAMTDLEIDAETCVPDWYAGDTIDWHMAVSALFPYPSRPY